MLEITYYGVLKDVLGQTQEQIVWCQQGTTEDLLKQLRARDVIWNEALAPDRLFRIVVNEEICYGSRVLSSGDRVAFLPPVTGG